MTEFSGFTDSGIKSYTIRDSKGFEVRILNYGCIITDIRVPDKAGQFDNVVLKLDSDEAYTGDHPYIGATVGRYANRIANGSCSCEGKRFNLTVNEPPNHLHGGLEGFDRKFWNCLRHDESYLEFGYTSRDGEEGYPGCLRVTAVFEITGDTELTVRYRAVTGKTTPVSITNHSYFNLTGDPTKTVNEHLLQIFAEYYTPSHASGIPVGGIAEVAGTPFDFSTLRTLDTPDGSGGSGYDLNYALRSGDAKKEMRPAAFLHEPGSGRKLEVFTEKPGMQLYTGGGLDGSLSGEKGRALQKFSGLCLETQFFPDAPNNPLFPSPFLSPGEKYDYKTVYRFSV